VAFLDSTDFEDAIRCAVSLGGDSDTLTCITGGIAEAFYGDFHDGSAQVLMNTIDNTCTTLDMHGVTSHLSENR
jgi:ADP-ribosylglycohydrolase